MVKSENAAKGAIRWRLSQVLEQRKQGSADNSPGEESFDG
jgi:hypothetical protein